MMEQEKEEKKMGKTMDTGRSLEFAGYDVVSGRKRLSILKSRFARADGAKVEYDDAWRNTDVMLGGKGTGKPAGNPPGENPHRMDLNDECL